MTRQEFDSIGKDLGFDFSEITDKQYRDIEFVYQFHPAIDEAEGKSQIAGIVGSVGMTVIYDMMDRARKARDLEDLLRKQRWEVEETQRALEDLRTQE